MPGLWSRFWGARARGSLWWLRSGRRRRSARGQWRGTPGRCRPADRDAARRALAEGVEACTHCRPDTALDVLD
ncbi:DUF6233 domain-containing protein [Streptomyces sp. LARHCF249]